MLGSRLYPTGMASDGDLEVSGDIGVYVSDLPNWVDAGLPCTYARCPADLIVTEELVYAYVSVTSNIGGPIDPEWSFIPDGEHEIVRGFTPDGELIYEQAVPNWR